MTLLLTLILLLGGSIPARSQPFSAQIVRALQVYGFTSPGVLTIDVGCSPVAYSFAGDTDTGFCRSAADTVAAYAGGVSRWDYNTTRILSTLALEVNNVGPNAIGGATSDNVQLRLLGAFTGAGDTPVVLSMQSTLAAGADGGSLIGLELAPIFQERSAGNHPRIANLNIGIATVNSAAATVTDTASLYVAGAMSATVSGANHAILSDAGANRFDGLVAYAGREAITVDAATTFAVTGSSVVLACTGAETINTITGAIAGTDLLIEHTDTDCTIVDDDDPTAANAIDLTGAATNDVGAVNKMIRLYYNGTYWLQTGESDN